MSKILIADYNSKELQRLKQLFESRGFEVITAADGPSVIAEFEEKKPDILLLSAMLSKKNGLDVCKKIKMSPDGVSTPVIIATSIYKGKTYKMKATMEYKADEYVEKPISDDDLVEIVKKHLKGSMFTDEILAETASRRRTKISEDTSTSKTSPEIIPPSTTIEEKKISDTDDLDKLISETLSGLVDLKSKRKKVEKVEKKEKVEKREVITPKGSEGEIFKEKKSVVEPKKDNLKVVKEEIKKEKKKPKLDTDAEIDALLKDTLSIALDLDKETIKKEKVKKGKDTGEVIIEKLKEEVVKTEEKSEGEKAVERILSSFDTDIEKKLSDTLHGVGLSDTNIEKTLEPEKVETEEEEEEEEGVKFGEYVLVEKIGHGGMAELFKAKKRGEEGFQKILAIKRILPHLSDNKELVTMFIDEAKLAAQLSHQNIATIFDFGKIDNSYYIAMEFVDGFDLKKILSRAKELKIKFPHKLAAYIAEQICSALDYAHHKKDYKGRDLKIVHRDVSPQNILISKEGEVKLVDFGISKAESKIHHTVKGALKGKLLYMSPEQAWGKDVDKRSDVYSMGIVLCEMVSGKVLFEDSSEYDVLEKVRSGKMPILENEIGKIPPKLRKIIKKALEIDISKRYQTAAEMASDLRKYINDSKPVPTSKDLRAFLTKLYPEEFGLKPQEVKNLTFEEFMEKFEEAKLLSEDTVILEGEKVKAKAKSSPSVKKVVKKKPVVTKKVVKKPIVEKAPEVKKQKEVKKVVKGKVAQPSKPQKTVVTKKLKKEKKVVSPGVPSFQVEEKRESSKIKIIVIAALVVLVLGVVGFILFGGGSKEAKKPIKVSKVNPLSTGETSGETTNLNLSETENPTPTTTNKVSTTQTSKALSNVGNKKPVSGQVPAKKNISKPAPKRVVKQTKPEKNVNKVTYNKPVSKPPITSASKPTVKESQKQNLPNVTKPSESKNITTTKPVEKVETKPGEKKPAVSTEKPKPVEYQVKSNEVKPKPVTTKPVETKPTVSKPVVSKPVVTKPVVTTQKPVENISKNRIREGDLVPLDSSVKPPKAIKNPKPNYPSKARILRAHATVIARILINQFGNVEKVRIITVIPARNRALFSDSVMTSLKKWKFKPAEKEGVKVKVWKTVRIKF